MFYFILGRDDALDAMRVAPGDEEFAYSLSDWGSGALVHTKGNLALQKRFEAALKSAGVSYKKTRSKKKAEELTGAIA